jgi:hypothetical protein
MICLFGSHEDDRQILGGFRCGIGFNQKRQRVLEREVRCIGITGEGAGATLDIRRKRNRRALLTENDFLNFATKNGGDRDLVVAAE